MLFKKIKIHTKHFRQFLPSFRLLFSITKASCFSNEMSSFRSSRSSSKETYWCNWRIITGLVKTDLKFIITNGEVTGEIQSKNTITRCFIPRLHAAWYFCIRGYDLSFVTLQVIKRNIFVLFIYRSNSLKKSSLINTYDVEKLFLKLIPWDCIHGLQLKANKVPRVLQILLILYFRLL